jgi:hypothetical protein
VRFHHRLVQIHPFLNGNGRHSRLMADLLVMQLGTGRFSGGDGSITEGRFRSRLPSVKKAGAFDDVNGDAKGG